MPSKILTPLLDLTSDVDICLKRELGRGAQGRVMEAVLIFPDATHYKCAAKYTFFRKQESERNKDQEGAVHQLVTDPEIRSKDCGVLRFIGSINALVKNKETHLNLTPRCDITLSACLKDIVGLKDSYPHLHNLLVFDFLQSIVKGLSHLARYRITHCDLKPENIGFYDVWCIFDFGVSKTYERFATSSVEGSYLYLAPEIVFGDMRFPGAGDIWSVGQILRQLLGMEVMTFLEPDQEIRASSLAWAKANAYNRKRDNTLTEDLTSYQIDLKNAICDFTSFAESFNFLIECMTQTLPYHRPNLETLQFAMGHLQSFQKEFATVKERAQFYKQMIEKYDVQQSEDNPLTNQSQQIYTSTIASASPDANDSSPFSMTL